MAQELKNPTLEELTPGGATYRFAKNLYGLQWWGDVCIKPTADTLYLIDPATGIERPATTRKTVNKALEQQKLGKLPHLYNLSFPWKEQPLMLIYLSGRYVTYNFDENRVTGSVEPPKEAANQAYCAASGNVSYTVANNLFVNGKAVTNEPAGTLCGQSVHRNEFGIHKGTFWSPTGQQLAFYRMDESMVEQYPLVDTSAPIAALNNIRYPMAGRTSHQVTVGIYTPASGKTIYLQTGDPTDRYFTNISWSPDEKSLYLIELNRDQNHSKLCQYNAETGELLQVLIEETHPKYVEPQHPILFLPWDNKRFIYQSQSDGYNHLYLVELANPVQKPLVRTSPLQETLTVHFRYKQLTSGNFLIDEILGFDEKKREILVASTENSPLQRNIFKINIASRKRSLIGTAGGVHTANLSASGNYLLDTYSAPGVPRNIDLVETTKGKSQRLFTAKDPFADLRMPRIETGTIKADDGVTDLYYRLIKPADFDPTKKYPAIVYVYGGPHAQMVTDGFLNGARGWDLYMANKGYILFSVDNRGSENRGLAFENATFRHLGIEEGKDQLKGAEFLQSLSFVDGNRIGVHGWSFGGHMTTALMLRYPEVFKVGVAGGPVIDWSYYEVMYGERYMDTPQSNPEGYKACNLNNLAGNLKGRLLLIHDDQDDTCVPQHTLSFLKACVEARTYPDLFIYPGHKHNVQGRDRVHLHEKITRYFEDYL